MSKENGNVPNEFIPASAVREIKKEFEAIIDDQAKRIRKMQVSLDKFREDNEMLRKRMEKIDEILAQARVIEEVNPPRVIKSSSSSTIKPAQPSILKQAQPTIAKPAQPTMGKQPTVPKQAPIEQTQQPIVKPAQPTMGTSPVLQSAMKKSLAAPVKAKTAIEEEWDDC